MENQNIRVFNLYDETDFLFMAPELTIEAQTQKTPQS
jgi:hypothetical protein